MLNTEIIHPELMRALAETGHGARILIGDANYPCTTKSNPLARRIFLNFVPGLICGTDIIRAVGRAVPLEAAHYMAPPDGKIPEVVREYQGLIEAEIPFEGLERFAFYDLASEKDTAVVIASGEQRVYANLLLTVGVRSA
ncbi:MAG: RbsD/FucU family protein [Planctomycetes bacterium]|nr:RbsD/FucU family protein [Planctomycetota bacterium]MCD7896420.1 RbsD/FucU family protein [Planctomycetaceae bacterium]